MNRYKQFALALAIGILPLNASAATATIEQILAHPANFDQQHVEVSGAVSGIRTKVSHRGNAYVTFSLCSAGCIHVFAFGSPTLHDGQQLTVHGTYYAVKHQGSYTFRNEIDADDGSLP
jgi:hypothetical protein